MIASVLLAMLVAPAVADSGSTELQYDAESTWALILPTSITFDTGIDGNVGIAGAIPYGDKVLVSVVSKYDWNVKLPDGTDSVSYEMTVGNTVVSRGDTILTVPHNAEDSARYVTASFEATSEAKVAGKHTDILTFITTVESVPIAYETMSDGTPLADVPISSNGPTVISAVAGTYTIPNTFAGKDVTIVGDESTVIDLQTSSTPNLNGGDLTLVGVTVKAADADYTGIQHCGDIVYDGCTFEGSMNLYGDSVTFKNCEFKLTGRYIWTYGAKEVLFDGCTFETEGKALLLYKEAGVFSQTVTIKDCTFTATKTAQTSKGEDVAAVEVDSSLITGTYTLKFEGTNTIETGEDKFAGWYRVKAAGSGMTDQTDTNVDVFINGVEQPFTVGNNPVTPSP